MWLCSNFINWLFTNLFPVGRKEKAALLRHANILFKVAVETSLGEIKNGGFWKTNFVFLKLRKTVKNQ